MCQFFDGSCAQAIDCNMDNMFSQALLVPNVLKEFDNPSVKIIGHPEFVFTESWSIAGYAAAFSERVFGTMVQRMWSVLNCRLHYGHPDYFYGLFVMFTTGRTVAA
jgi:1,3-beta-glucan synthase